MGVDIPVGMGRPDSHMNLVLVSEQSFLLPLLLDCRLELEFL